MPELPDRRPTTTAGQLPVPAHHRPPAVEYRDGVPYHYTVGQPPAPQQIVIQMPDQQGISPQQRELMLYVAMWLVVLVVCVAAVCAVVVICGGTLMGIIGAVGSNAATIGVVLVAVIVAAGWASAKFKTTKEK